MQTEMDFTHTNPLMRLKVLTSVPSLLNLTDRRQRWALSCTVTVQLMFALRSITQSLMTPSMVVVATRLVPVGPLTASIPVISFLLSN